MVGGGSGAYLTTHVKFIVDPLLINKSGPPIISVTGSENRRTNINLEWIFFKEKVTPTIQRKV